MEVVLLKKTNYIYNMGRKEISREYFMNFNHSNLFV